MITGWTLTFISAVLAAMAWALGLMGEAGLALIGQTAFVILRITTGVCLLRALASEEFPGDRRSG